MLLYNKIRGQVTTLSTLGEPLPITYKMSFDMIYLGHVTDLMHLELKHTKSELGWLYGTGAIVVYEYNGSLYECWLSDVKQHAEEILKDKVFIGADEKPAPGLIQKTTLSGCIVGYTRTEDVIKFSKIIQEG